MVVASNPLPTPFLCQCSSILVTKSSPCCAPWLASLRPLVLRAWLPPERLSPCPAPAARTAGGGSEPAITRGPTHRRREYRGNHRPYVMVWDAARVERVWGGGCFGAPEDQKANLFEFGRSVGGVLRGRQELGRKAVREPAVRRRRGRRDSRAGIEDVGGKGAGDEGR